MDQDPLDEYEFERGEPRFAVVRAALLAVFMASSAGAFFITLIWAALAR